jgi:glycine/D-amino acid oxidase-like deaminating enzyme/nitrite reductase/ring-hydroxylating ferredoxin subunit
MVRAGQDSRESQPLWTSRPLASEVEALTEARFDTVVVGAGIAGLSVAYELLGRGHSVAVLDKSELGAGETGRSTAHLSDALDDRYVLLERVHGEGGARLAAESHRAGIESIARIVEREGIQCGFDWVDGYLFEAGAHAGLLEREAMACERAGVASELVGMPKNAFGEGNALRFPDQAQLDPAAYLRGLARAVQRRGGHLHFGTHVVGVEETHADATVHLVDGTRITAPQVVVATNTPIHDLFTLHTKMAAYRTYVVGLSASRESLPRALFWDDEDPYHYVRWADDETLIFGGEDHRSGQEAHPEQRWDRLVTWAREHVSSIGPVTARWSGQVFEPMDGLAFIGRNPGIHGRTYVVTGDSGNGMTHGALAGMLISDLILGEPNPWARVYDPARKAKRLTTLKEYLRENAKVAAAYTDWLRPAAKETDDIAPGHGAVVQRGGQKVALYVDEEGGRHACSAVCPHLAGVVRWNAAERSWDCPCHGSRFDPYGHVITGPASRGLTPRDVETGPARRGLTPRDVELR